MGCSASIPNVTPQTAPLEELKTLADIERCSCTQIKVWLDGIGLGVISQNAVTNAVSGEMLIALFRDPNSTNALISALGLGPGHLPRLNFELQKLAGIRKPAVSVVAYVEPIVEGGGAPKSEAPGATDLNNYAAAAMLGAATGAMGVGAVVAVADEGEYKVEETVTNLAEGMVDVVRGLGPAFLDALEILEGLSLILQHAPLVGAVGAAIRVVLQLARGNMANKVSCTRLTERMLHTGRLISRADVLRQADDGVKGRRLRDLFSANNPTFRDLTASMVAAERLIARYSDRGWWRHVLSNGSDRHAFEQADQTIQAAAKSLLEEVQIENVLMTAFEPVGGSAEDQVHSAVVERVRQWKGVASVTDADIAAYLSEIEASGNASELIALLPASEQVLISALKSSIASEIRDVKVGLDRAHDKLDRIVTTSDTLLARLDSLNGWRSGLDNLSPSLRAFWMAHVGSNSIPWNLFKRLVLSEDTRIDERVRTLRHVDKEPLVALTTEDFLERIVRHKIDQDADQTVTVLELHVWEVECQALAQRHAAALKFLDGESDVDGGIEGTFAWYLSITRQTFSLCDLDPLMREGLGELRKILRPVDFQSEINSFAKSFIPGTRQWLFREVDLFLSHPENRALIILGPSGFGKSSFSANLSMRRRDVIAGVLFFRQGESIRRSAPVMLRSLAFQLAAAIPKLWKPIRHAASTLAGDADADTVFQSLLLAPLAELERDGDRPSVSQVIVLDALDEAHDAGQPNAIAQLLLQYFAALPDWIRLVVTMRPRSEDQESAEVFAQLLARFKCREISASHPRHVDDLRLTCEHRLRKLVPDDDPAGSAELVATGTMTILELAKGSFHYVNAVFQEVLEPKKRASPTGSLCAADLAPSALPDCISALYFNELRKRVAKNPEVLDVLRILVVAREAPAVAALASLVDRPIQDPAFLALIEGLVPFFILDGTALLERRIRPSHISIIEFLTDPVRAQDLYLDRRECERDLVGILMRVFKGLEATDPTESMANESPCYFIKHAVAHAIDAGLLREAETILSSVRFLKASVEFSSARLYHLKLELVERKDKLSPGLLEILEWFEALTSEDIRNAELDSDTLNACVLSKAPPGSAFSKVAAKFAQECERMIVQNGKCTASALPCNDDKFLTAWRKSMIFLNNAPAKMVRSVRVSAQ